MNLSPHLVGPLGSLDLLAIAPVLIVVMAILAYRRIRKKYKDPR